MEQGCKQHGTTMNKRRIIIKISLYRGRHWQQICSPETWWSNRRRIRGRITDMYRIMRQGIQGSAGRRSGHQVTPLINDPLQPLTLSLLLWFLSFDPRRPGTLRTFVPYQKSVFLLPTQQLTGHNSQLGSNIFNQLITQFKQDQSAEEASWHFISADKEFGIEIGFCELHVSVNTEDKRGGKGRRRGNVKEKKREENVREEEKILEKNGERRENV